MNQPDIEVRTYFVRGRNALVARGDFSEIFAAWILHRADQQIALADETDTALRELLLAQILHSAGRPHGETTAWTVHFTAPLANVFVSTSNPEGTTVANAFVKDVKTTDTGLFYVDVVSPRQPPQRSVTEFTGVSALRAVEGFYAASIQRTARFFHHHDDDFVMVAAQPDVDLEWLQGLDEEAIRSLDQHETLSLLERRAYRYECGCNHEKMLDVLLPVFRREGDALFGEDPSLRIQCPRCSRTHTITRESLEARALIG